MMEHLLWGTLLAVALTAPVAWKWQLGVFKAVLTVTICAIFFSIGIAKIPLFAAWSLTLRSLVVAALSIASAGAILLYRFYRDPERTVPGQPGSIVSPADGLVIYVLPSQQGTLPESTKHGRKYTLTELTKTSLREQDATVVGISMNLLDVHVNRAPVAGRVSLQRHFSGLFGSLRKREMVFDNERATTVIESEIGQVAIVQIASRLVRQIVPYVKQGQSVALGERIGAIRLGSQVDIVLPASKSLEVTVRVGERVRAGESIIARFS